MAKWEYATVPLIVHATKQILDQWGEDGWELVQVVPGPDGQGLVAYLKRPLGGVLMAGRVEARLAELGLDAAGGRRAGRGVRAGGAGRRLRLHLGPAADGRRRAAGHRQGRRGDGLVPPAEAARSSRGICALNALAAVKSVIGDLDRVTRVVKVVGFVASDPAFTGQPAVINGASELLGEVFGDHGVHARSAVGVAVLPLDAPVEVEVVVSLA